MQELSIFVDESGDYGAYEHHAPYYIVTLVLHEQSHNIYPHIDKLNAQLESFDLPNHTVHAGPLIRGEGVYRDFIPEIRRPIFYRLFQFVRTSNIRYHKLLAIKRHANDSVQLSAILSKQLATFIREHLGYFHKFDHIIVYYDNGQIELARVLASIFSALLSNIELRKVTPSEYKLFQAADLLCTLELLRQKAHDKTISKSELRFFHSVKDLRRTYLKSADKLRFD